MELLGHVFIAHVFAFLCVCAGFFFGLSYKSIKRDIESIIRRKKDFGDDYRLLCLSMKMILISAVIQVAGPSEHVVLISSILSVFQTVILSIGCSMLAVVISNNYDTFKEILLKKSKKFIEDIPPYRGWIRYFRMNIIASIGTASFSILIYFKPYHLFEKEVRIDYILCFSGFLFIVIIALWAAKLYGEWLPEDIETSGQ